MLHNDFPFPEVDVPTDDQCGFEFWWVSAGAKRPKRKRRRQYG